MKAKKRLILLIPVVLIAGVLTYRHVRLRIDYDPNRVPRTVESTRSAYTAMDHEPAGESLASRCANPGSAGARILSCTNSALPHCTMPLPL